MSKESQIKYVGIYSKPYEKPKTLKILKASKGKKKRHFKGIELD